MKLDTVPQLTISSSPHIRENRSVQDIMRDVVISLMPAMIAGFVIFGFRSIMLICSAVIGAVLTEYLISEKMLKKHDSIRDWSAVITGILVAMNMPVAAPIWMAALGSAFAIAVAKWTFGGLGNNFINPALAGRAFLMASFPAQMTGAIFAQGGFLGKVPSPLAGIDMVSSATAQAGAVDALTSATPLAQLPYWIESGADIQNAFLPLFWGNVGGCIGETSAIMILIGAIFLLWRRVIGFTIPVTYVTTVFVLALLFSGVEGASPFSSDALSVAIFHVLSGGLLFGAVFMATDMVTSPITIKGQFIFALGCGVLTFVIRKFGGYPEGVSYSILLMNLVTPLIDRYVAPRVYGTVKK